jgi:hypothetical protein
MFRDPNRIRKKPTASARAPAASESEKPTASARAPAASESR